jgi:ferrochelatase
MRIRVQPPYFDRPDYVHALVAAANPFLQGGFDHLLFSFHGVPERQIHKSDPTGCHCLTDTNCCEGDSPAHPTCYRAQCYKTASAFVKEAGLKPDQYSVSFQSRLGRHPWLKPYTDFELPRLAQGGKKKMLVMCPSFVADCLETIEEIGMRGRETFLEAGGKELVLIPCLNEHPLWVSALQEMVKEFCGENGPGSDSEERVKGRNSEPVGTGTAR